MHASFTGKELLARRGLQTDVVRRATAAPESDRAHGSSQCGYIAVPAAERMLARRVTRASVLASALRWLKRSEPVADAF